MNNFIKKPSGISEIAWNHMNNINVCKIINITKEDLIINKNNDIEGERNCYSIKFSQEQLKDITVNDIEALFKLIIYQRKILLKELNIEFMYSLLISIFVFLAHAIYYMLVFYLKLKLKISV